MLILLYLFSLGFSRVSGANEAIEVKLSDGRIRPCFPSHKLRDQGQRIQYSYFLCPGADERPAILREVKGEWEWAEPRPEGGILSPLVLSVSSSGQSLYDGGAAAPNTPGQVFKDLFSERQWLLSWRDLRSEEKGARLEGKPHRNFLDAEKKIEASAQIRLGQIAKVLDESPEIEALFEGEQSSEPERIRCRRAKSVSARQVCDLFVCEPIQRGGKVLSPLLYHPRSQGEDGSSFAYQPFFMLGEEGENLPITDGGAALLSTRVDGRITYQRASVRRFGFGQEDLPEYIHLQDPLLQQAAVSERQFLKFLDRIKYHCANPPIWKRVDEEKKLIEKQLSQFLQEEAVMLVQKGLSLSHPGTTAISTIVPRSMLPERACTEDGKIYWSEDVRESMGQSMGQSMVPRPRPIPMEEAERLFRKIASNREAIAFDYFEEGCYARAELMVRLLEEEGVQAEKVWAVGGDLVYTPPPKEGQASNPIEWHFHVAPSVWVHDREGRLSRVVFDPAIDPKTMMSVEGWLSSFRQESHAGKPLLLSWPLPAPYEESVYWANQRTRVFFTPGSIYQRKEAEQASGLSGWIDRWTNGIDAEKANQRFLRAAQAMGRLKKKPASAR